MTICIVQHTRNAVRETCEGKRKHAVATFWLSIHLRELLTFMLVFLGRQEISVGLEVLTCSHAKLSCFLKLRRLS